MSKLRTLEPAFNDSFETALRRFFTPIAFESDCAINVPFHPGRPAFSQVAPLLQCKRISKARRSPSKSVKRMWRLSTSSRRACWKAENIRLTVSSVMPR